GGARATAERVRGCEEILGERGVILHPPYSRPAPRHRWPLATPFDAVHTALFSVTGMPATGVPVGFDHPPLPLARQRRGRGWPGGAAGSRPRAGDAASPRRPQPDTIAAMTLNLGRMPEVLRLID